MAYTPENSVVTISKAIQVSIAAGIDNLSGHFLKDGAEVLSKPAGDFCNLSITFENILNFCKVAKLKPLYKNASLAELFNFRLISLLALMSRFIEEVIHDQANAFLNL